MLILFLIKQQCPLTQLLKTFQEYTITYPSLGMTVEEFQKFLIEFQQVRILLLHYIANY